MTFALAIEEFDFSQFRAMTQLLLTEFTANDRLLSPAYTQWLYEANPCGRAKVVIARDGTKWIGFMALIPVSLIRRYEVLTAYYVVNVLVDSAYRGRSIFAQMIEVAHNYVRRKGAILMGHPNAAAVGAWRRAKMHFQFPLTARIVPPRLTLKNVRTNVLVGGDLSALVDLNNADVRARGDLCVSLTEDYVNWRFIQHPTNTYLMRSVIIDDEPAGFWVVRKLRTGLHLLVELFVVKRHAAAAIASCPILTLACTTEYHESAGYALWRSPIKKELAFFCTDDQTAIEPQEAARLGLAASDF